MYILSLIGCKELVGKDKGYELTGCERHDINRNFVKKKVKKLVVLSKV